MAKQPSYRELFRVGDVVEVAHAPLDGETETQWLRGKVIKISTRLHVAHGGPGHMAYERADYNKGIIRKVKAESSVAADNGRISALIAARKRRCASRLGTYECALPDGHDGEHSTAGGFTRWLVGTTLHLHQGLDGLKLGDRVESGKPGTEEYDTGTVVKLIYDDTVRVYWDRAEEAIDESPSELRRLMELG